MGRDTNIDFLSQILRKLWGIKDQLAQTAILFSVHTVKQLPKDAGVASTSFVFTMCEVQVNTTVCFVSVSAIVNMCLGSNQTPVLMSSFYNMSVVNDKVSLI